MHEDFAPCVYSGLGANPLEGNAEDGRYAFSSIVAGDLLRRRLLAALRAYEVAFSVVSPLVLGIFENDMGGHS